MTVYEQLMALLLPFLRSALKAAIYPFVTHEKMHNLLLWEIPQHRGNTITISPDRKVTLSYFDFESFFLTDKELGQLAGGEVPEKVNVAMGKLCKKVRANLSSLAPTGAFVSALDMERMGGSTATSIEEGFAFTLETWNDYGRVCWIVSILYGAALN